MIDQFRHSVIERWSRHRSQEFIRTFASAVVDPTTRPAQVESTRTAILDDDRKSEILFDSYRAVCLSRSKTIGPRAIGLLTARILAEERLAASAEETWFQVYELLSDTELISVYDFYSDAFNKARIENHKDYKLQLDTLTIDWAHEDGHFKSDVDRSPFNLHECIGSWAGKLDQLGLITTRVREKVWDYGEDSERGIDEAGTARRIIYEIILSSADEKYTLLIKQAIPHSDNTTGD